MGRDRINSRARTLVTDDGAVFVSIIQGEQIHLGITLDWLTNLTGYTMLSKVVEADMAGSLNAANLPVDVKTGGQVVDLTIIDTVTTDNSFVLVIPQTLITDWAAQPEPEAPVYGWLDLEVADTGTGAAQQVWKPFRGLVEVRFSPTEEASS